MIHRQESRDFSLVISNCDCAHFCPQAYGTGCPMVESSVVVIPFGTDDEGGIHPDVAGANLVIRTALVDIGLTGEGSNPIPLDIGRQLIEKEEKVPLGCDKLDTPAGTIYVSAIR